MRTYVRTSKRIAPGVTVVSYQNPGQYLLGLILTIALIFAALHSVFGSWLPWVISAFVFIMWLGALSSRRFFAKLFWSLALIMDGYFVWISQGCPGNSGFCAQLEADRIASEKAAAIERAAEQMEDCATRTMSDWRLDTDCRIYTAQEIAVAKAKHDARVAAEEAKREADFRREQAERAQRLLNDRDAARRASGAQP